MGNLVDFAMVYPWRTVVAFAIVMAFAEAKPQVTTLDEYGQRLHPEVWKAAEAGSKKDMSQTECRQSGVSVDSLCRMYGQGSDMCNALRRSMNELVLLTPKRSKAKRLPQMRIGSMPWSWEKQWMMRQKQRLPQNSNKKMNKLLRL